MVQSTARPTTPTCQCGFHSSPSRYLHTDVTPLRVHPPHPTKRPFLFLAHLLWGYNSEDTARLARTAEFSKTGDGYFKQQSTQPQTLGYNLSDSPSGLLAWIYEKLYRWTDNYPWTDDESTRAFFSSAFLGTDWLTSGAQFLPGSRSIGSQLEDRPRRRVSITNTQRQSQTGSLWTMRWSRSLWVILISQLNWSLCLAGECFRLLSLHLKG
jgi:hypothetical protein